RINPNARTHRAADEIVRDIERKREHLGVTLATLERETKKTVNETQTAVSDTVTRVKHALDLRYQVKRHPWPFVGGATVLGAIAESLLSDYSAAHAAHNEAHSSLNGAATGVAFNGPAGEDKYSGHKRSFRSIVERTLHQFDDELRVIKHVGVLAL